MHIESQGSDKACSVDSCLALLKAIYYPQSEALRSWVESPETRLEMRTEGEGLVRKHFRGLSYGGWVTDSLL